MFMIDLATGSGPLGSRGQGRGPQGRGPSLRTSLAAAVLGVAASTAQALTPLPPVCYPHQEGASAGEPSDLGSGIVSRSEAFGRGDDSWRKWEVVTQCESGLSIAVQLDSYDEAPAVRALVRSAIASPEVITFSDLAQRLDHTIGQAFIDEGRPANVETCVCNHFYPDLRGTKAPYPG